MTNQEIIDVVKAHSDGYEIECSYKGRDEWLDIREPCWDFHTYNYRVKAKQSENALRKILRKNEKNHFNYAYRIYTFY